MRKLFPVILACILFVPAFAVFGQVIQPVLTPDKAFDYTRLGRIDSLQLIAGYSFTTPPQKHGMVWI